MTFYPTNDRGVPDLRRDYTDADDGWEPIDAPYWRDLALDAWEEQQRAEAEHRYQRRHAARDTGVTP